MRDVFKKAKGYIYQIPTNGTIFRNAIGKYNSNEKETLLTYKRNGIEINKRWRNRKISSSVDVDLLKSDKLYAQELNAAFKTVRELFNVGKSGGEYITTCRHMSQPMSQEQMVGFISTSNKCMPEFGNYKYLIKIPIDAKIGIIELMQIGNVSGQNLEYIEDLFEIVLPETTQFYKSKDGYYVVKTPYSTENKVEFNIQ